VGDWSGGNGVVVLVSVVVVVSVLVASVFFFSCAFFSAFTVVRSVGIVLYEPAGMVAVDASVPVGAAKAAQLNPT
jgi:hypothetical protein